MATSSSASSSELSLEKELPELPTPPGLRQRIRQVCLRLWIWELLSLLVCVSCVGTIAVILLRYDGQPLPKWRFGLTINGVISVLAGIAKASMILPVAESISQLKWHWFWRGRSRPVMDFEYFDIASRGPWGCLVLLFRPRQWGVATVGAAITVLALLMEPSLQFIPSYPSRMTGAGSRAAVNRTMRFEDVVHGNKPNKDFHLQMDNVTDLGRTSKNAMNQVVYGIDTRVEQDWTCTTSNCTWPEFSSLAMCSHCTDLSDQVYRNADPLGADWLLPNNMFYGSTGLFVTEPQSSGRKTIAYNSTAEQSVVDFFYMYRQFKPNGSTVVKPYASECIFYFCVQRYSADVVAGVYTEQLLSSWPGPHEALPRGLNVSALTYDTDAIDSPDLILRPPGDDDEYKVDALTLWWLKKVLEDDNIANMAYNPGSWTESLGQTMNEILTEDKDNPRDGPNRVMTVFAKALTAAIRRKADKSIVVEGKALREELYVKARWWWAILPVALVGLSCSFMLVTLIITARHGVPVWKSSALATLAHGLDHGSSGSLTATRLDAVENKARGHRMAMTDSKRQWRLEASSA